MHYRQLCLAAAFVLTTTSLVAQKASKSGELPPAIPMPPDRAADSYRIYSSLIPLGETAGSSWPHDLWLVRNTTITVVNAEQACSPTQGSGQNEGFESSLNPHGAVHPTDDRLRDFAEILEDFDRHCHDRIILNANSLKLSARVRLLNPEEQKEFEGTRFGPAKDPAVAAKYQGAPALYGFSEVYFNKAHTIALLYATHWCGSLCGQGFWLAFALSDGQWKHLRWNTVSWIS